VELLGDYRFRHGGGITCIAAHPDGKRVLTGSQDNTFRLWDLGTGKELRRSTGHSGSVTGIVILPDGKQALTSSWDRTVRLWDLETGKEVRLLRGHHQGVWDVVLLPGSNRAVSGGADVALRVWDLETGEQLTELVANRSRRPGWVLSLASGPDGRWLAAGGRQEKVVYLWDMGSQELAARLEGHRDKVTCVAIDRFGKRVVSGSEDKTLRVWDLDTKRHVLTFDKHQGRIRCLAIHPNGKWAISGGMDETLRVWELQTGKEIRRIDTKGGFYSVALHPDGKHVLAGNVNKLRMWDLESGDLAEGFDEHSVHVRKTAVLPDRRHVFAAGGGTGLFLWDLKTGRQVQRFDGHTSFISGVAVLPDGKRGVSASWDESLRLWDLETGKELRKFGPHPWRVEAVVVCPDGKRAVTASSETLTVWDLETGRMLRREKTSSTIRSLALHPDGRHVLAGCPYAKSELLLWDTTTGSIDQRIAGSSDNVWSVAVHPNGRWGFSGHEQKVIRQWDLETGRELRQFRGHEGRVWSVAVGPDGDRVLGGTSGTVRLWDIQTGRLVRRFSGHQALVLSLQWLGPDKFASSAGDGNFFAWDVQMQARPAAVRKALELTSSARDKLLAALGLALQQLGLAVDEREKAQELLVALRDEATSAIGAWLGLAKTSQAQILKLCGDLGDDDYKKREAATESLMGSRWLAQSWLRRLAGDPKGDPEVKARVNSILKQMASEAEQEGEAILKTLYAIDVLEWIGSEKSKALLLQLTRNGAQATIRAAAEQALRRLMKREGKQRELG